MARLITARVPFAGTITVSYLVDDYADDAALVDSAYDVAVETLGNVEWPYFTNGSGETGDFMDVEAYKKLLDGGVFRGYVPTEVKIDSDEPGVE